MLECCLCKEIWLWWVVSTPVLSWLKIIFIPLLPNLSLWPSSYLPSLLQWDLILKKKKKDFNIDVLFEAGTRYFYFALWLAMNCFLQQLLSTVGIAHMDIPTHKMNKQERTHRQTKHSISDEVSLKVASICGHKIPIKNIVCLCVNLTKRKWGPWDSKCVFLAMLWVPSIF